VATVPASHTFTDGVATSSEANAYIRDPIQFNLARPLCDVYSVAVQSIPNNVYTALTFDTEYVDRDPSGSGGHSTSVNTSRFTAVYAGYYGVIGAYTYAANAAGFRGAVVAVNGTQQDRTRRIGPPAAAGTSGYIAVAGTVFLNVGDYVEIMGVQNTGAGLNTDVANLAYPSMRVVWEGTA